MNKLIASVKKIALFTIMLGIASCNSTAPEVDNSSSSNGSPKKPDVIEMQTGRVVRVKNYNQYNMTLQKLTGLNRSKYSTLFESIKGSLPSDNDISGMTSFNIIAMSRLADAYCVDYVNQKMPADLFNANQEERIIDHLFNAFLDAAPESDPDYYLVLKTEISNVLSNEDGNGGSFFPTPNANIVQSNKNYTVAACMVILVSPYVTLLE